VQFGKELHVHVAEAARSDEGARWVDDLGQLIAVCAVPTSFPLGAPSGSVSTLDLAVRSVGAHADGLGVLVLAAGGRSVRELLDAIEPQLRQVRFPVCVPAVSALLFASLPFGVRCAPFLLIAAVSSARRIAVALTPNGARLSPYRAVCLLLVAERCVGAGLAAAEHRPPRAGRQQQGASVKANSQHAPCSRAALAACPGFVLPSRDAACTFHGFAFAILCLARS
jgi:hypothetical protein